MFASLKGRIISLAVLLSVTTLSLGGALLSVDYQLRDAYGWVNHTQEVLLSLDNTVADLREAESGLRGYLLTGSADYLGPFDKDLAEADTLAAHLADLVADNPPQERRAIALRALVRAKSDIMVRAIRIARAQGAQRTIDLSARARGKAIMDQVTDLAAKMRQTERDLLAIRTRAADGRAEHTRLLLLIGWPTVALLIAASAFIILRSVNRPLSDLLEAVSRFGDGEHDARVPVAERTIEFSRLSTAYNGMADSLVEAMTRQTVADQEVARANVELSRRGTALEARNGSIELVSDMAQRMQALHTDGEFVDVLECFLPKTLPDHAGALYVLNNSRNLLVRCVAWGKPVMAPESLSPDSCWALRRGLSHSVKQPGDDVLCSHAASRFPIERRCEPVLAGGDVLGLLYVEGALGEEQRFRLERLSENIALALVNENLRRRLREQSIRDPLTGLFNRRYMEEALTQEIARAQRNKTSLSVAMTDVDHFKRFNDEFGHEAGDVLLKTVAVSLQSHFRDGDIVCRYGGEEFLIITPGADVKSMHCRTEEIRQKIGELVVDYKGRRLGPVTMSFGVDGWEADSVRSIDQLTVEADRALYRAKRLGRNRIELAADYRVQVEAA